MGKGSEPDTAGTTGPCQQRGAVTHQASPTLSSFRRFTALLSPIILAAGALVVGTTAEASPADVGEWSAPIDLGAVAIHATLTHNDEVLMFEYPEGHASTDNTSRVITWNWRTGETRNAAASYDRDFFCAGHNHLSNDHVYVAGGHEHTTDRNQDGIGAAETDTWNPLLRRWTPGPVLSEKRWYPTTVGLPNGKVLIFGGQVRRGGYFANTVESYDPRSGSLTTLPSSATRKVGTYPRMHLMPDGTILKTGPERMTQRFNPATNTWSDVAPMVHGARKTGGSILLEGLKKVLAVGGTTGASTTDTLEILDTSQPSPAWRLTADPMQFARRHSNLVLLPDGKVLIVGGGTGSRYDGPAKAAEMFDPATETTTTMASQVGGRMYHSTALLLPDGRVLSAGQDSGPYETTAELYSPPYLFAGPRPTITAAPSQIGYGGSFDVSTPNAASVAKVALIRAGSVTHQIDTDRRYVRLNFTASASSLSVAGPASRSIAPAGWYMLFILTRSGDDLVPSVAKWVHVG
jgi:galactose oxidase